jgi:histidinol-phosphatase (PHP family)
MSYVSGTEALLVHVTNIGKIFVREPLKQSLAIPNRNMPFSHHSHSGQFCGHAANTLEEVVQAAIAKGMTTFCMTEHMPRELADFYPEEVNSHDEASLSKLYDDFYIEARRLQKAYASQIQLFVGFEGEWIRPGSLKLCENILEKHDVDLFIGSVHHVYTVPIDFDLPLYHRARDMGDGTDERIAADYFDSQYEMLQALKPPVVAHFDLIRLKSDDPERSFRLWPQVWEKIERNLQFIAKYGGVLELNSSSLRKGMSEPYPQVEICKVSLPTSSKPFVVHITNSLYRDS